MRTFAKKKPRPASARENGLAISKTRSDNHLPVKSREREQTLEGRVSAKAAALLRRYAEDLALRCAERTVPEYVAHVRAFLTWIEARSLPVPALTRADLHRYQAERRAAQAEWRAVLGRLPRQSPLGAEKLLWFPAAPAGRAARSDRRPRASAARNATATRDSHTRGSPADRRSAARPITARAA